MEEVTSNLERKFAIIIQSSAQMFAQLERALSRAAAEKQRGLEERYRQLENARKAAQQATSRLADTKWWEQNGAWNPQAAEQVAEIYELAAKWAPLDESVRHNLDMICANANQRWGINLKEPSWMREVAEPNQYTATTDETITIKPETLELTQNEGTDLESLDLQPARTTPTELAEQGYSDALMTDVDDPQQAQTAINAANARIATKGGAKALAQASKASMVTDREFEKLDDAQQAKRRRDLQDSGVELLSLQVAEYYANETPVECAERIDSESTTLTELVPAVPQFSGNASGQGMEREAQIER